MPPARGGLVVVCWAAAVCTFLLPLSNPDIFWHLSAARHILATGAFPRADWLSFTMSGRPWVDFEWLCELIWYGTLHLGGMHGLLILKCLILTAAAACLWKTLGLCGPTLGARGLSILAFAVAVSPSNDLRADNFSLLLFCWQWWMLESRRLRLLDGSRKNNLSPVEWIGFVGAYVLWANLHAGFVYGLILLGVYAGVEARHKSWELLKVTAACAAATLVNPYGFKLYAVLADHSRHLNDLQRYIVEWQETGVESLWLTPFWLIWIFVFAVTLVRYFKKRDVPLEHIVSLCFFGFSAGRHVRATMYFTAIAVPVSVCHLRGLWPRSRWREGLQRLLGAALFIFFAVRIAPHLTWRHPFIERDVPEPIAQFLESERDVLAGKAMLNPWQWGGYLGYRLDPGYKVFMDGRYIFHPLLKAFMEAQESPEAYGSFLGSYGIDVVLLKRPSAMIETAVGLREGKKFKISRPYYLYYLPRTDWALVFWSDVGSVFVRRLKARQDWLKTREFQVFRPDDSAAAQLMVQEGYVSLGQLDREVKRYLSANHITVENADRWRTWVETLRATTHDNNRSGQ